jgi:hypothetical protein
MVKMDIKALKNFRMYYSQLMNFDEVPDSMMMDFLQEAANTLKQMDRIIKNYEYRQKIGRQNREVVYNEERGDSANPA